MEQPPQQRIVQSEVLPVLRFENLGPDPSFQNGDFLILSFILRLLTGVLL